MYTKGLKRRNFARLVHIRKAITSWKLLTTKEMLHFVDPVRSKSPAVTAVPWLRISNGVDTAAGVKLKENGNAKIKTKRLFRRCD